VIHKTPVSNCQLHPLPLLGFLHVFPEPREVDGHVSWLDPGHDQGAPALPENFLNVRRALFYSPVERVDSSLLVVEETEVCR